MKFGAQSPRSRPVAGKKGRRMALKKDAALVKLYAKIDEEETKFKVALFDLYSEDLAKRGKSLTLQDLIDAKRGTAKGAKLVKAGSASTGRKPPFKGPQPAKYRDPKSGATWSGKGRAPGWIANAKSRDKFLIEQAQ